MLALGALEGACARRAAAWLHTLPHTVGSPCAALRPPCCCATTSYSVAGPPAAPRVPTSPWQSTRLVCSALRQGRPTGDIDKGPSGRAGGGEPRRSGPQERGGSGQPAADARPRLAKVLAAVGVASRRACEDLIGAGSVRVNGNVVSEQGVRIDPGNDVVDVWLPASTSGSESSSQSAPSSSTASSSPSLSSSSQRAGPRSAAAAAPPTASSSSSASTSSSKPQKGGGGFSSSWKRISLQAYADTAQLYYFAVHKPKGYICSNSDAQGKGKLAVELLQPWLDEWHKRNKDKKQLPPRFFTVGRLDVATSGLIFITNDGQWANQVIHPSANITKEYIVGLAKAPTREQLKALAAGAEVEGSFVQPVEVEVLEDNNTLLRIVVQEGKKHEVRVLVDNAAMELIKLKRVRIGGYRLPRDLNFGSYKELRRSDLRAVTDAAAQQGATARGRAAAGRQQQQLGQQEQQQRELAKLPPQLRSLPAEVLGKLKKVTG